MRAARRSPAHPSVTTISDQSLQSFLKYQYSELRRSGKSGRNWYPHTQRRLTGHAVRHGGTDMSSVTTEVIRVRGLTFTYPKSTGPRSAGWTSPLAAVRSSASLVPAARASPPRKNFSLGCFVATAARRRCGARTHWVGSGLLPAHRGVIRAAESLSEAHRPGEPAFFASLYDGRRWTRSSCLMPLDLR